MSGYPGIITSLWRNAHLPDVVGYVQDQTQIGTQNLPKTTQCTLTGRTRIRYGYQLPRGRTALAKFDLGGTYDSARRTTFPYSQDSYAGGCVLRTTPVWAKIFYCPRCRDAKVEWEALVWNHSRSGEQARLLADFNADGIQDMAVCLDRSLLDNAGGQFTLYLRNSKGRYRKHGEFFAHPMALFLEKIGETVRLWTYYETGESTRAGEIGYRDILKDELSEYSSITIDPHRSRMGSAISELVFKRSDLPITVEWSNTKDGIAGWGDPNNAIDSDNE